MTDEKTEEPSAEESLFETEDHPEIKTEVEPEAKPEEKTEETTDESKTEETEAKPEETKEVKSVPIAALHDKKRQVDQLKEENERLRQQLPASSEAPDPYEDIDKYNEFMRNKVLQEVHEDQNRQRLERIDKSRSQMLEKHSDYYEMEKIFEIMTASQPELIDEMLTSGNEAQYAYNKAKEYKDGIVGTPQETTEKPSEDELRNKSAVDTPSLATATAQASNLPQAEKEETIEDVFADIKY